MKCVQFVILLGLSLSTLSIAEDARILMDCYVNGQPVKLAFDTGAEGFILFNQTVDRLKLSIIKEAPRDIVVPPGAVRLRLTEKCTLQFEEGGQESSIQFAVVDIPSYMNEEAEGLVGFGGLKDLMFELKFSMRRLKVRDTWNFDKSQWQSLDIRKDLNVLVVKTSNEDETQDLLLIDTGSQRGLTVNQELWKQLTGDKTNSKTTLSAIYSPGVGLRVNKERWIQEMNFGDLSLHEIPLGTGFEAYQALKSAGIDGILGMWGLTHYTWIVDGPAEKIYFKENDLIRKPEMYEYNRLGVVFVPEDIQTGDALIAHVIEGGPGWRAGIRDGDELLRIGQLDATKWRTDPDVMPLGQFWTKPAGTVIDLVLLRNNEKMNVTVTLEEIFQSK